MCKQRSQQTPIDCDVFCVNDFYMDSDITITGNLYISGDVNFYADDVTADEGIYVLRSEEDPSDNCTEIDVLSFKTQGELVVNCLDYFAPDCTELIALEGCIVTN